MTTDYLATGFASLFSWLLSPAELHGPAGSGNSMHCWQLDCAAVSFVHWKSLEPHGQNVKVHSTMIILFSQCLGLKDLQCFFSWPDCAGYHAEFIFEQ